MKPNPDLYREDNRNSVAALVVVFVAVVALAYFAFAVA